MMQLGPGLHVQYCIEKGLSNHSKISPKATKIFRFKFRHELMGGCSTIVNKRNKYLRYQLL
jgi:hypothetical protein